MCLIMKTCESYTNIVFHLLLIYTSIIIFTLFINDVVIINHATNILYDEVSRNRQLRQSKYLLRA